jgi:hypothetical protein
MASGPQLYAWGKLKVSGDNTTHPMPLDDLSGWNVRALAVPFGGGGGTGRAPPLWCGCGRALRCGMHAWGDATPDSMHPTCA